MSTKQFQYILEYTRDPNHSEWVPWLSPPYASFSQAEEDLCKLSIREQEFNLNSKTNKEKAILGFRIVEKVLEIKNQIVTEILF